MVGPYNAPPCVPALCPHSLSLSVLFEKTLSHFVLFENMWMQRFGSRRPHTADEEDVGAPLSVEQPHSKGHDDHDVRKAAGACLGKHRPCR